MNRYNIFSHRSFVTRVLLVFLSSTGSTALAWGPDGHSAIGILALNELRPEVRQVLKNTVGPPDEQSMVEACNWPDAIRKKEEWEWSAPQHYVNIPRGESTYLQSRDCPDKRCLPQAIKRYAAELGNRRESAEQHWQAFAWLCHLVGDIHQPLHAGFADDRGGNDIIVVFRNREMNLHHFWDSELIHEYAGSWQTLVEQLQASPLEKLDSRWTPNQVDDWANESHALAAQMAYPPSPKIDQGFEKRSWELVQRRLRTAASRLAWVLDTELGSGE